MTPSKSQLDALRIDRSQDESPSFSPWVLGAAAGTILLLLLGAAWVFWPRAIEVQTAPAIGIASEEGGTVLKATGYVTARRRATVSSKVTGKVVGIHIEEGMEVEEGQVLAELDTSNVNASLALAQAQLSSSRSALRETEVRLKEAKLDLSRIENLVSERIASQADLDEAQAEVDSLSARLLRQKDEVGVAERQVEVQNQELEDRVIRSPFDGIVIAKNAQPGEMISPAAAGGGFTRTGIGTVVDMSSLEIEVDVNEAYIGRVQPDQPVFAVLDAYPSWRIPCHVIAIIPTADRQKATVQVRVGFDQLDPRILPDMGVKVSFQEDASTGGGARAVSVPEDAVVSDGSAKIVWVVQGETVERRAVRVGIEQSGNVSILSGLREGENVVRNAPKELADGDKVKVKNS